MIRLNGRGWKTTLAALLALLLAGPGWAMLPDEPPPPKPAPKPAAKPEPKPAPKPKPKPKPAVETSRPAPVTVSGGRFTDNRNGTVTDNRTGLVWLKNANCFGQQDWSTAMASARSLASGACGLRDGSVAGQWRLPSKEEWEALIDKTAGNPALPTRYPFTGVVSGVYWSSTTTSTHERYESEHVWYVTLSGGYVGANDNKSYNGPYYVWPVRGGR